MNRTARLMWIAGGWACIGLGILGLILPGLPATCFFIAASYLLAKGSPRLQRRLLEHPRVGPSLRFWHRHRAMPRRAKGWALGTMWAGMVPGLLFTAAVAAWLPWVVLAAGLVGSGVILFGVRTATGAMLADQRPPCLRSTSSWQSRQYGDSGRALSLG